MDFTFASHTRSPTSKTCLIDEIIEDEPEECHSSDSSENARLQVHETESGSSGTMEIFGASILNEKNKPESFGDLIKVVLDERHVPFGVEASNFEDADRVSVLFIYQDTRTPVSWYADTRPEDIRDAIICACDAISDSKGFSVMEVTPVPHGTGDIELKEKTEEPAIGRMGYLTIKVNEAFREYALGPEISWEDLSKVTSGSTFLLKPKSLDENEQQNLKQLHGTPWRRVLLEIDPMKHVEAIKAIEYMKQGTNLLRHDLGVFPHLRRFRISPDSRRLLCYTNPRTQLFGPSNATFFSDMRSLITGQQTKVFLQYRLPMLEHLSFSIALKNGVTLDLTCKDEGEYDIWVCGFKALIAKNNRQLISKKNLLMHSTRFLKELQKENLSYRWLDAEDMDVDYKKEDVNNINSGTLTLDKCLELPFHSLSELQDKALKLSRRMQEAITRMNNYVRENGRPDAQQSSSSVSKADETVEFHDLLHLIDSTKFLLQTANKDMERIKDSKPDSSESELLTPRKDLNDMSVEENSGETTNSNLFNDEAKKTTIGSPTFARLKSPKSNSKKENIFDLELRRINQTLWKAEVDIENISDMVSRLETRNHPMSILARSFVEVNEQFVAEMGRFAGQLSNQVKRFWSFNSNCGESQMEQ
eukprot:GHVP01070444.1.p1 GENE.GHVP01070444.1~~GHVP01070444.1.p1  ORF type:complete len:704 (+),score=155.07 GHVP01070444.1:177-2114(+)